MRILHIISMMKIGGAQRLLSDILPLINEENEVTLMVSRQIINDFSKKVTDSGVKIRLMGSENFGSPSNIFRIVKLVKGYDIVHVHLFPMLYWAAFASCFTHINLVYTEHSTSNRRRGKWYYKIIEKFVYSRYKKIISISSQTQVELKEWLKAKKDDKRFVVINNGVNLKEFKNIREEKPYPFTLIMVSRFVPAKDQNTVIKAIQLLPGEINLIFVGDGDKLDECKRLADSLGVSERVHFVGKQSNVNSWIAKADIGIQSSNWEGFGLTAVEIMAAGKPIIASNVDGLRQVVEGAGYLFPVGDYHTLASLVMKLYRDKALYDEISIRCLKNSEKYNVTETAKKYLNVYKQIV